MESLSNYLASESKDKMVDLLARRPQILSLQLSNVNFNGLIMHSNFFFEIISFFRIALI